MQARRTSCYLAFMAPWFLWTRAISSFVVRRNPSSSFHTKVYRHNHKNGTTNSRRDRWLAPSAQSKSTSLNLAVSSFHDAFVVLASSTRWDGRWWDSATLHPQNVHQQYITLVQLPSLLLTSYSTLLRDHPVTTKAATAAILAACGDAMAQYRSFQSQDHPNDDSDTTTPTTTTTTATTSLTNNNNINNTTSFQYDAKRGATFLAFGALYTGVFQHYWFQYLSAHIGPWGTTLGIWERSSDITSSAVQLDVTAVVRTEPHWWSNFDIVARVSNPPTTAELAIAKVAVNQFLVIPTIYMPLFFALTGALGGLDFNQATARAQALYIPILKRNYAFWLPTQFIQFFVLPPELQIPFLSCMSLLWTIILSSIGSSTQQPAAMSQIVAYETVAGAENGEDIVVNVVLVDAGPVNAVLDEVRLADVSAALVSDEVSDAVKGVLAEAQAGASGVAIGLLASTADEGTIGAAVGNLVNAEVGVGVALVAAVSAGVGILAAASMSDDSTTTINEEGNIEAVDVSHDDESVNHTFNEIEDVSTLVGCDDTLSARESIEV